MDKNLKSKIKLNKVIICILILIVIVVLIVLGTNKLTKAGSLEHNNISNFGMVTYGDDYVFYLKQENGIVKIKDKKEYQITEGAAYSLNYKDEYVYYMTTGNGGSILINRIKQNGEDEEILATITSPMTKMYLEDNYLYYATTNPNTISRMDLNGENQEIIITRTISDFEVEKGIVYFTDESGYLYKISVNSEDYGEIGDKILAKKFQILGNYAYYFSEDNDSLMRIDLEGKSEEVVSDKLNCNIFNVTNKSIYYLDKDSLTICSININGGNPKEIVKINTENTKLNVYDDILYYVNSDGVSYKTYRIKTNGKETEQIKY